MQLPDLSAARLLIVGDVMLDRYWFGDVSRISPEAPVPVVKVERTEDRPGGAANVARNAAALGAQVALLSVVGDDEPGTTLARLIGEVGISTGLHVDPAISTTVKLRVIGRQQQLLRIDFETAPSHDILRAKLAEFESRVAVCDVVVLSDYGKGGLTHIEEMIRLARAAGKKVWSTLRVMTIRSMPGRRSSRRTVLNCVRWSDVGRMTQSLPARQSACALNLGWMHCS